MKFSIKDFFGKCDQIRKKLRIWSHLPKKSFMVNFIIFVQWYLELVTSTEAMEVKYSFISSLLSISLSTPYKTSSGNWKSNVIDAKKTWHEMGESFYLITRTIINPMNSPMVTK